MKKRILALFLAGVMTFTMAPAEAFATTSGELPPDTETEEMIPEKEDAADTAEDVSLGDGNTGAAEEMFSDMSEPLELPEELAPRMAPEETKPEEETELPEDWAPPVGGMEQPKVIELPEGAADSLDTVDLTENADGELLYRSKVLGSQQYSSPWDIYSSNYIYNRLNENERTFWDALDIVSLKYLTGTWNAQLLLKDEDGNYYGPGEMIVYERLGISKERMSELFMLFTYSNPQYYFLGEGALLGTSNAGEGFMVPVIYEAFANGTARAAETARVKAQIDAMEAQIAAGTTELEKIQIAHDLIIRKVMYDHGINLDNPGASQTQNPYHQSAYSVFATDYTVCAGYTKAFTLLVNGAGIDAISVTSYNHAWNLVSINDSWYQIDCTWDDMDGEYGRDLMYGYFNRSTAMITGALDQQGSHRMEAYYNGMVPVCTQDSGATADSIGSYVTPTAQTAAPVVTQQYTDDKVAVTLTSATPGAEIYYTIDSAVPSSSATRCFYYRGTFTAKPDTVINAVAVCDTLWDSGITTARAETKTYTVKFDTGGGSKVSAQQVTAGKKVKKPSNPKRKKYTFEGWYTSKKYKTKWNFGKKVTKNMTLYAKWKKVSVKQVTISKVTNVSGKKMKVTLKKVSGAKGYEIRYATNSKMKSSRRVTATSTGKTIKNLKKGKTYYVQARAYKKDSRGNKVYGSWSKKKTVAIQK